ncbi:regulatory protein CII bacteriophage 186 [Yersinia nurmii]|uniref:Regulatory protein CII bacteriophage 186 n=1 Tax=Yersinia nurmii TaxID=685706 RepID=A0ABP1YAM7_9GAMM|nr:regulatory protein CII bacteriophage 186 [Yersinia nurmii]
MFDFSVSKHPHFDNACRQFALKHNLVELAANAATSQLMRYMLPLQLA